MEIERLGDKTVILRDSRHSSGWQLAQAVKNLNDPRIGELTPAPRSLGISLLAPLPDPEELLSGVAQEVGQEPQLTRAHTIPVCYDFGIDHDDILRQTGLSRVEMIDLHMNRSYTCLALGFCPGFPYLGPLHPKLQAVARRSSPRTIVEAGSVALAGGQTGIYPLARPGGWQIIGRTPVAIADLSRGFFPIAPGDTVTFVAITKTAYHQLEGTCL